MKVYLDNASTTPMDEDILEKILPYFSNKFGNPSSLHSFGRLAEQGLLKSREQCAKALGAKETEIYFTGGGTESNNWAIKGVAYAAGKSAHILVSAIEHSSLSASAEQLEKEGYQIEYLPVDEYGTVSKEALAKALKPNTALVSIMSANNEVGTVQPITDFVKIVKDYNPKILFHTDAVQAVGSIDVNVERSGVDMLSLSGHKIYGPKGCGLLYIKHGTKIVSFINGGSQERGLRAGTVNVPLIVGLGYALEKAIFNQRENAKKITELRDYFINRVLSEIPNSKLNGDPVNRLPANAHFIFMYADNEAVQTQLDLKGIASSIGAACSAGSVEPSKVLLAMGIPKEIAGYAIRFSLGKHTTQAELDYTVDTLKSIVSKVRELSPLFVNIRTKPELV